jgi:hypothetical protein
MTLLSQAISFALVAAVSSAAAGAQADAPWTMPRKISAFQFLLDRSPFSLPTAEESSPLADRFSLTGAVALDGEALVFVLDKTTQTRYMLSKIPNKQNMGLVEYLSDPDPRRMRATIRVDGQVATIAYAEPNAQPQQMQQPVGSQANRVVQPQQMPQSPSPHANGAGSLPSAIVNAPAGSPAAPGSPAFQQQPTTPPNRRVIRRRMISSQPPGQ